MKKIMLLLFLSFLLAGCTAPAGDSGYRQVSMDEAVALMDGESGYIILDVRTAEEFNDSHIPGAVNIPNEEIGTEEIPNCLTRIRKYLYIAAAVTVANRLPKSLRLWDIRIS